MEGPSRSMSSSCSTLMVSHASTVSVARGSGNLPGDGTAPLVDACAAPRRFGVGQSACGQVRRALWPCVGGTSSGLAVGAQACPVQAGSAGDRGLALCLRTSS